MNDVIFIVLDSVEIIGMAIIIYLLLKQKK